ncbi:MAG: hypothetical protein ABSD98_14345 [Candidatus Korobacteraceae bacterium]
MKTEYTEQADVTKSELLANEDSSVPMRSDAHQVAQRSFGQMWGLHPGITLLTLVVDTMLFGANAATLGAFFPVSLAAACVLGFITYRAQMRWYGDDSENARIKAVILAFLTAIPTPLPAFLYVPAGAVGLVHLIRRKS